MIRYVLFDLDDTLYPSSLGLEDEMSARIGQFLADYLGMSVDEARTRRKEHMGPYGTTLEWLMAEEGLTDIESYYAAVHPEGEEVRLRPDPTVRAFIETLPVPAAVLTNAPMEHATRVLRKIELEGLFTHIFDIRWNGLKGKPREDAFLRVLSAIKLPAEQVLFVDDIPSYVEGFAKIGGRAVLIDERGRYEDVPQPRIRALPELARFLEAQ